MFELVIACGILGLLILATVLDGPSAMALGVAVGATGLLVGIAAGWIYHLRLRTQLQRQGQLPRLWWLQPTNLHKLLDDQSRTVVLPWFRAGVAFMGVHAVGVALYIVGAVKDLILGR